MKTTLVLVGLLASATAQARNYGIHALSPTADGWFLTLEVPTDRSACVVELKDVSPLAGPLLKWVERVQSNAPTVAMWLDPQRYMASHTYRMTLRCGLHEVARGVVQLASKGAL